MKIINTSVEKFRGICKDKKFICFGAGDTGRVICEAFQKDGILDSIQYFVDNDSAKWGKKLLVGGQEFDIKSPQCLQDECKDNIALFITSRFWDQIVKQLEKEHIAENLECYIYILFKLHTSKINEKIEKENKEKVIPKKIHYCWFGGKELPEFAVKCIESWKKYCPDYEIIQWDETNYNVYKNRFTKEVYEYGHYSALSSYARFDIIHQFGGIYLDTDVEVVRSLDDLLYHDAFMGFEVSNYVNSGHGFGGKGGNELFAENVRIYDAMTFYNEKGEFHYKNAPSITTEMLVNHGLKLDGTLQKIEDTVIYPSEFFDPALQIPIESSYSVHKYSSLWSFKGENMEKVWEEQRRYYYQLTEEGRIEEY